MTGRPPTSREEAAAVLLDALAASCPAGEATLIGSLARPGEADHLSDLDVSWTVPPDEAPGQLEALRTTLQQVGTVESLRVDPGVRRDWRLVFVRFRGWPLWWRVDLEVHAPGAGSMEVPAADPWTPEESACMGVVVTLKAIARDRPGTAEAEWVLARQRVGAADVGGDWPTRIGSLLDGVEAAAPSLANLVARTRQLARDVLGG